MEALINRPSLTTNLEARYRSSKIKEVSAPTVVDFIKSPIKGFTLRQQSTELLATTSIFVKNLSRTKYYTGAK